MITEAELHDAFHDRLGPALAGLNPGPAMLESLRGRVRRRNRLTVVGATAGVVAIVAAVAGVAQLTSGPGRVTVSTGQPSGPASLPSATTATVPLMTSGVCAGLAVTATDQDIADKRTLTVAPGSANVITMPGNDLMYLQASGPCVSRLTFRTSGNLQGPDPSATLSTFNSQRTGVVISKAAGRGTIELLLGCDPTSRSSCPATSTQLATITVTVTAPNGATGTQQAQPAATATIPNVIGEPIDQALTELTQAGFAASQQVVEIQPGAVASVVAETPAAGSSARPGSTVTLSLVAPSPSQASTSATSSP
jgi:hypothetical protein